MSQKSSSIRYAETVSLALNTDSLSTWNAAGLLGGFSSSAARWAFRCSRIHFSVSYVRQCEEPSVFLNFQPQVRAIEADEIRS
ncbi:hypothetical protein [Hartmannibacter diazotrophicus]|uniref:hypothetical protein n=1 Tax=Hartmannibacter diazotrophicus TaxID=1482074 RepID=UPI0012FE7670|nr:hypothetical protein [Hartmannibacter diazotrophicus]